MKWSTQIHFGFHSDQVEMEFTVIKSWRSFKDYFEDARHVTAVTYCDSPDLLLELIEGDEIPVESLDVVVGDDVDYREQLTGQPDTAKDLERHRRNGNLVIRTSDTKQLHSKIYIIENHDGSRVLINGSANFTRNAWTGQTNAATVFYTDGDSVVDEQFENLYEAHLDVTDEFMEDLSERLENLDEDEDPERVVELWVDGRQTTKDEASELHTSATEQLKDIAEQADETVAITDDPAEADETVAMADGASEEGEVESTDEGVENANEEDDTPASTGSDVTDFEITLSTRGFDSDGYVDSLGEGMKTLDASVGRDKITASTGAYTRYLEQKYEVPQLWIDNEHQQVHLQSGDEHRILTDDLPDDPSKVDDALANIEAYLSTVDDYGESNHKDEVKAHMMEAVLYAFWAPFINVYAERYYREGIGLDKGLPFLYIYGESDSGKGTFSEFVLSLISDGLVTGAADADEIGKRRVRAMRQIDTAFPLVVDDITKQRIKNLDTLRNFWASWNPQLDVQYPAFIFISNDKRPKEWFRNRAKLLHFDVKFKSSHRGEAAVHEIINEANPIYAWVSHLLFEHGVSLSESGDDALEDIRDVILELYDYADREVPNYFPRQPAEELHDPGKRLWQTAYEQDVFELHQEGETLIAEFDLEATEVYRYEKNLPTEVRGSKRGREVVIKNRDGFFDWFEKDVGINKGGGILSRFF